MMDRVMFLFALAACGDDGQATLIPPPPSDRGVQLRMTARLEPGDETSFCRYFELPENTEVARFEHAYTAGSHHLVLYPTALETPLRDDTFPCDGDAAPVSDLLVTGVAYGDQRSEGEIAFPDGVAYAFEHRVVLMQAHYLDATDAPLDAEIDLNLWTPDAHAETAAGTLFFYHTGIDLHPAPATAVARMRCAIDQDITLVLGMSHMHRRGTNFVSRLEGDDLASPISLHTTPDWASPTPTIFNPPIDAHAGQSLTFECMYTNDGPNLVTTGSSAVTDEMCVFAAPYYPKGSDALEHCSGPLSGETFAGTATCMETMQCIDATAPFDDSGHPTRLDCMSSTCAASSLAAQEFFERGDYCYSCPGGTFTDCAPTRCPAEWAACQAATCN